MFPKSSLIGKVVLLFEGNSEKVCSVVGRCTGGIVKFVIEGIGWWVKHGWPEEVEISSEFIISELKTPMPGGGGGIGI